MREEPQHEEGAVAASPVMHLDAFIALGESLFGSDKGLWAFVCPVCGHVATTNDYLLLGAPTNSVGFSCIGLWMEEDLVEELRRNGNGPCRYAPSDALNLNPLHVDIRGHVGRFFDFYQVSTGADACKDG